jgi:hypothetical protein
MDLEKYLMSKKINSVLKEDVVAFTIKPTDAFEMKNLRYKLRVYNDVLIFRVKRSYLNRWFRVKDGSRNFISNFEGMSEIFMIVFFNIVGLLNFYKNMERIFPSKLYQKVLYIKIDETIFTHLQLFSMLTYLTELYSKQLQYLLFNLYISLSFYHLKIIRIFLSILSCKLSDSVSNMNGYFASIY